MPTRTGGPSDAAKAWAARKRVLAARAIPKTFAGLMGQILTVTRDELRRLVYSRHRKYRTGTLVGSEVLTMVSDVSARIVNTASSTWEGVKAYYAWFVALGIKERTAPTSRGKAYYAWVDPPHARPTTPEEWEAARAAGWGHRARHIGAVEGRNWRRAAMESSAMKATRKRWSDRLQTDLFEAS